MGSMKHKESQQRFNYWEVIHTAVKDYREELRLTKMLRSRTGKTTCSAGIDSFDSLCSAGCTRISERWSLLSACAIIVYLSVATSHSASARLNNAKCAYIGVFN